MSAVRKYEQFHGHPVKFKKNHNLHVPTDLVILGRAVAIEYESDKLNGGGDGKKAIYRHKFSPNTLLCCDEKGKRQLYILGSKLYVNDRGIVK